VVTVVFDPRTVTQAPSLDFLCTHPLINCTDTRCFSCSPLRLQNECPPSGYDSVYGVAGADLNYSEVVVYDEARVVPSYLIVYSLSAQAATPDKGRVLSETNTAHELHSWSPPKENTVWTGLESTSICSRRAREDPGFWCHSRGVV